MYQTSNFPARVSEYNKILSSKRLRNHCTIEATRYEGTCNFIAQVIVNFAHSVQSNASKQVTAACFQHYLRYMHVHLPIIFCAIYNPCRQNINSK
jgi:hypothetical protein